MSGVKYIDLEGNNFTLGTPITIKGVYNAVKSTRKRIVLTNFSINGAKSHDIEGSVIPHGFNEYYITYVTELGTNYFTISNNDEVTLTRA